MAQLTIGQVHNSYLQADITALSEKVGELRSHFEKLPKATTKLTPKGSDTTRIRTTIHTCAGLINNLLYSSIDHWMTLKAVAIPHMNAAEKLTLDNHLSDTTSLKQQYHQLCVEINPFLATYDEALTVPGEGKDEAEEEEEGWLKLSEYRLVHYREEVDILDELVDDLEDMAVDFKVALEDTEDVSSEEDEPMFDFGREESLPRVIIGRKNEDQRVATGEHRKEIRECVAAVDGCLSRVKYWDLMSSAELLSEQSEEELQEEMKEVAERSEGVERRFSALCRDMEAGMSVCGDSLRG
ncbi:hypothetical protein P167DRAFT_574342 [Morchella conica CCBAS932]|uniref:Uncharacterized protein n=1 Tax=Morchella conica CCBAS932 TaxID=1392247 RepID=A0A3N4L2V2_9PEZI|nr:hypothetical protein P167DRAFT_574342 [Morchella conica CCBAS932]